MKSDYTTDIHKNFLNVFLKNPQPGDSVRDAIATALGLPEKIGIVLETERNEGKKYAHVKWIGYTEDSVATEEDLLGIKTKNTQWVLFSDIIVLAKAIDEQLMLDTFIIKKILERIKQRNKKPSRVHPDVPIQEYYDYQQKEKKLPKEEERGVVIIEMR